MKPRTHFVTGRLLLILSLALAACSNAATALPTPNPTATEILSATLAPTAAPTLASIPHGGRLIIAETGEFPNLNPFLTTWHSSPHSAVFDTLVRYNQDYSGFSPGLAEKWEIGPDNLSVTFTLRQNATFSDGTPVDAVAIKWNLDRYRDKTIASPASDVLGDLLTDVKAVDERTVVLEFSKPYAPLFDFLNILEMASPTAFEKWGPDDFGQHPVGSGPWVIKEIAADNHVLFTRNSAYAWGPNSADNKGAPYPEEFEVKYVLNDDAMYAALETGEVHITSIPGQFLEQAQKNPNIGLVQGMGIGEQYFGFNTQHPPFDNKNIRLAFAYALNRDEIILAGYQGQARPIYGPLAPTEFGYSEAVETEASQVSYDLTEAKELLAAEGWTDTDGDEVLDKGGSKMEFRLIFPPDDAAKRVAETVQSQLADVGIKVNLVPEEVSVIKDETVAGTHELFLLYFGLLDPRILSFLFHSDNIGSTNRTRFSNAELDKLLEAADAEMNPDIRKQKVEAVLRLLIQEHPFIPMAVLTGYTGYRKDLVGGLKFDKLGSVLVNDAYLIPK